jgi:hypothetical protein
MRAAFRPWPLTPGLLHPVFLSPKFLNGITGIREREFADRLNHSGPVAFDSAIAP